MDLFNKKKLLKLEQELDSCNVEKERLLTKYSPILSIEKEIEGLKEKITDLNLKKDKLASEYKAGKKIYNDLLEENELYESRLDLISYGHYEPIFNFNDSEKYKNEILEIKIIQKDSIKYDLAIKCHTEWTVEGSRRIGKSMTNKQMKLMLRAFNNECDALIAKVKWNNIESIEKRIEKSFVAINKLGAPNHIEILSDFLYFKIKELKLTHEYNLKKHEEKEEKREINARIREEEKAQRDFQKAKDKAEKEEALYQKALEKAKKDLGLVSGNELEKLQGQITQLEENLRLAREQKERALSMAQQTKSGYVYVISNVGSFGEGIYKIGLTRRLEPLDRVRELGDSSVPFIFDVHAMIYSSDAPSLEYQLHQTFKEESVNLVNFRKEFFEVSLDEIEKEVNKISETEVEFIKLREAQQYRESITIRENINQEKAKEEASSKFPESLFDINEIE